MLIPRELEIQGVYFSPILLVMVLALIATLLTTKLFNRLRWTRFLVFPQLIFVAFIAIYIVLIGTFIIRI